MTSCPVRNTSMPRCAPAEASKPLNFQTPLAYDFSSFLALFGGRGLCWYQQGESLSVTIQCIVSQNHGSIPLECALIIVNLWYLHFDGISANLFLCHLRVTRCIDFVTCNPVEPLSVKCKQCRGNVSAYHRDVLRMKLTFYFLSFLYVNLEWRKRLCIF